MKMKKTNVLLGLGLVLLLNSCSVYNKAVFDAKYLKKDKKGESTAVVREKTEIMQRSESISSDQSPVTASLDNELILIPSETKLETFNKTTDANVKNLSKSVETDKIATKKQSIKKIEKTEKVKKEEKKSKQFAGGKSQLIALILAAVVGGLGIHRFYLGYIGIGVIQLLTLGGCGVWALIDLIRIITGDLKPKGGDYTDTL